MFQNKIMQIYRTILNVGNQIINDRSFIKIDKLVISLKKYVFICEVCCNLNTYNNIICIKLLVTNIGYILWINFENIQKFHRSNV